MGEGNQSGSYFSTNKEVGYRVLQTLSAPLIPTLPF